MKWNYIATIAALVLLVGTGIYWFNNSPAGPELNNQPVSEEKRVEVINGEEVILETPLTQSFSNAESNKIAENKKQSSKGANNINYAYAKDVVKKVTKPFVVGMYYLENIKRGFDKCALSSQGKDEKTLEEKIKEDGEFELLAVHKNLNESLVFTSAESSSETTCLRIIKFNKNVAGINPIHIFVK